MNICILTDRFPPHGKGGASNIAADIAAGYRQNGHNIFVITTISDEKEFEGDNWSSIAFNRVTTHENSRFRAYYSIYNPATVSEVASHLEDIRPDAVHAHNVHEFLSYHTLKLASNRSIPVVLTYHDAMSVAYGKVTDVPEDVSVSEGGMSTLEYHMSPLTQLKRYQCRYFPLRNILNRAYLRRYVDVGVGVSHELAEFLRSNDIPCSEVIHNGINAERFKNADGDAFRDRYGLADDSVVLFGGRVSYQKGAIHLARAFESVVTEVPNATLVVTGADGMDERMTDELGTASNRLITTGWLDEETMPQAFAAANVVTTPSLYLDPFPTVNLEAMASGTPVVTTCFGGGKELVEHRQSGIIVNPFDVDELAAALTSLLNDPDRRTNYGESARQRINEQFNRDRMVSDYERLLTNLTEN